MELTGAEILMECFLEQGVDTVFGYPGGQILPTYDALYQYADRIRHILTAHEQGASHAADGYARASGRVGVCIATSGPGATNLVTGIATAMIDSVPLVAITGNVPIPLLGKDSFQEVDIFGVTMPVTKHNFIVKDVAELADTVREAFFIAKSGRPGPVLVDIPKDVQTNKTSYHKKEPVDLARVKPSKPALIAEAARLLAHAKRPFIYAGGGVIRGEASKELFAFQRKLDAPISTSLMGLGCFPSDDPAFTRMIGMHGSKASNSGITECDLLVAVGARFSDRVVGKRSGFAPGAHVLHLDVDPAEINKNVPTDHHLIGELSEILALLTAEMPQGSHPEWKARIAAWKDEYPLYANGVGLTPQRIIGIVDRLAGKDKTIVADVGQHQMWAGQCFSFTKPRSFIVSGGMGTMGFSLGASIGAILGLDGPSGTGKHGPVVTIVGDGGFRMNCIELATAAAYGIPVKIIVMNNGVLGMVRQWQTLFYGKRYSQTVLDRPPDFVKLAEAYGVKGFRISSEDQAEKVLAEAFATEGPCLVDCVIGKDEMVFPMVAPGASISDMIFE
jgi:acetolactate synthase I/II/III large subunit